MELLFIQSQEHPKLPIAELKAVIECENIEGTLDIITEGLVILRDISDENLEKYYKLFVRRLGYTHEVHEVISKFKYESLEEEILKVNWQEYIKDNFAVRVKRFSSDIDTVGCEREVGSLILSNVNDTDIKVKLENKIGCISG